MAEAVTTSAISASNSEPEFPSSETGSRSIDENTPANMNIGAPVAATDSDTTPSLTYALTGTDASSFKIVTTSGQIQAKDALNFESKSSYSVNVTVHDGLDAASDTDTTVDDTQEVTITVNNVNEAPTITSTGGAFTDPDFDENGTGVVATYTATDPDTQMGNTLSWSLDGGDDESDFSIDQNSGALTFNTSPNYEMPHDSDMDNEYHVTVKVTDNGIPGKRSPTLNDMIEVTVTVDDVNEAPDITTSDTTKNVPRSKRNRRAHVRRDRRRQQR